MSVIMTLRARGDAAKIEERAGQNPEGMREITEKAKQHGLIAHRFYASDDGEIMVIDEWPDPESFQRFFAEAEDQIGPLMREAGVTEQPSITFWRKLETHDEVGWGA